MAILLTIASVKMAAIDTAPPQADARVKALSQATNSFGQDLVAHLPRTGNLVFSPYSISTALALALSGARGATEEEMIRVLRHQLTRSEIDAANATTSEILAHYRGRSWLWKTSPVRLAVANAVMLTPGSGVAKDYLEAVETSYGAQVMRDGSVAALNSWVKQKTDGKIAKLVNEIPANTVAILLNAIYFKAAWERPFDASLTRAEDFEISKIEKIRVPLMQREGDYSVAAGEGYFAIRLAFQNPLLHMVIVLPDDVRHLDAVSARLNGAALSRLFAELGKPARLVRLALPRFQIEFDMVLTPFLKAMGLSRPFDPTQADLSGMTGGARKLWIGDVVHVAKIEVSEEGAEAAAATAAFTLASARQAIDFRVTRPFLFYVIDDASGAILFQGRIVDPRGGR